MQPRVDCVAEAVALTRGLGADRWVGFNDGKLEFLAEAKRLAPQIPVFWDLGAKTSVSDDVRIAREHGFESIVLQERGTTPEKVRTIRAAGVDARAWTINDPERMICEWPITLISDRVPDGFKTLRFSDTITDWSTNKEICRELIITGSGASGLPTALDNDVTVGLLQLSKNVDFKTPGSFSTGSI